MLTYPMATSTIFRRLPLSCLPLRYAIEIKPCSETSTFIGKQTVTVEMTGGTSEILLNAKNLTINGAKFNGSPVEVVPEPETEKICFRLPQPCQAGSALLDIDFVGQISDKMCGFYRSKYTTTTADQEEKSMLITDFEPTGARQAFPCWDEPNFKSIFSITLVVPKIMTALSNMPVASKVERDNNCVAYMFEDTPKMSTYIVAYAVGEFEYVEARDKNGILIRVYSRPGMVSELGRGELALKVACRALPFYGDFFGTRYPLPKSDMLAIPDFAAGAMENWGLITYRERALLTERDTASPSSQQQVALTVSHELAHMWFGNLVTMKWWTDLWLNEGFATWIEYLCVDHCFPEWNIWNHFTYGEMASALRLDALENSHPVEVEVNHPDEIEEIFDSISYSKGASLIRMLHAYLGDTVFRDSLRTYLKKHAYGNAVTEDLWAALGSTSGVDVAGLMSPWTKTAGFPVLKITPLAVKDGHVSVELQQTQYQLPSSKPRQSSQRWPIPIVFTCHSADLKNRHDHKYLLNEQKHVLDISLPWPVTNLSDCIVQANAEATGLYHVCYTEEQLNMFIKHFHSMSWSNPGKFAFINDGFALAKTGFVHIDTWLKVLPSLMINEQSYAIWRCVLSDGLSTHVGRLIHEGNLSLPAYHAFLRKLIRPALDNLGFFSSNQSVPLSHDSRLLRSLLVMNAGAEAGDQDVIAEAKRRFEAFRSGQDADAIPGDLRLAVLTTVVRHADNSDALDYLMKLYITVQSPDEKSSILSAVCSACDRYFGQDGGVDVKTVTLDRVLKFCLQTDGPVRDQDRVQGLTTCASWSVASRQATWEAVKTNWDWLSSVYRGQFLLSRLIKGVLNGFATEEHITDVKNFFDVHPAYCARAVKQVHETMDANHMLLVRDKSKVASVLAEFES